MSYPLDLTIALTGATADQLNQWRHEGLLKPEVCSDKFEGFHWSFRDLVAIRSFMKLRTDHSLQAFREAMLDHVEWNLTERPEAYVLVSDGTGVFLGEEADEEVTGLLKRDRRKVICKLDVIFAVFRHPSGSGDVVDLRAPRPHLEINEARLGGFPTIRGTRVAFDSVANLVANGTVSFEDVGIFYPGVSADDARDAWSFMQQVEEKRGWA